MKIIKVFLIFSLISCTTPIDINTYAPVIDTEKYNQKKYQKDLASCRKLGIKVKANYEAQRKKEKRKAMIAGLIGAAAGAALGSSLDSETALVTGAYTGAIVGTIAGSNVDYNGVIAKFGPTAVVDRCMQGRGYKILSIEGYGGGN